MEDKYNILENISILVIGYDGYKDVWDNFAYFINKNWKDRPKTYLATSELEPKYNNIEVIKAGNGSEWSKKARNALKRINTKYVILLLEDFFIIDYVDNNKLIEAINFIEKNDIKFYQLTSMALFKCLILEKKLPNKSYIHIIPKTKKYGLNLQGAIWNRDYLMQTIGDGNYNAWEFEGKNFFINNYEEKGIHYVIDDRNILNILHTVLQSKYFPSSVYKCRKIGHDLNNGNREILSVWAEFKYRFKSIIRCCIPKALNLPFKRLARHLGFNFVIDKYSNKSCNNLEK